MRIAYYKQNPKTCPFEPNFDCLITACKLVENEFEDIECAATSELSGTTVLNQTKD